MKVPDVEFDRPACPIPGCMEDLVTDYYGEYRCEECLMSWGTDGGHGHLDDDVPRCGAVGESLDESVRRVCYLPASHVDEGRPHHAGYDTNNGGDWIQWDSEGRA